MSEFGAKCRRGGTVPEIGETFVAVKELWSAGGLGVHGGRGGSFAESRRRRVVEAAMTGLSSIGRFGKDS